MSPTKADWRDIVERLVKAEKEAIEWRSEADRADKEVVKLKRSLAGALKVGGGGRAQALVAEALGGGTKAPRQREHDFKRRDRTLAMIKERGGFLSTVELSRAEKVPSGTASSTLRRLAKEGHVHQVSRGRYALGSKSSNATHKE